MATNNNTILGRFILNGTTDVQQRLGYADNVGTATVERLFDPMNGQIYNDFAVFLINRVGYAFAHQQRWENPLKPFFKGKLQFGSTVTESMLQWIRGHSYNVDADTQFKTYYPDGLQAFHTINHQINYPISVSREQLRQAFADEYGLNQLVAAVMAQPMNADEYDIYMEMLSLFKRMDVAYTLPRHQLSAAPTTKETCDEFLQALQQTSYDMTVPSAEFSNTDIPVFAEPDELVLFVRSSVMAATNVQSLAAAFNLEKVEIQYRIKVVPDKVWPLNDDDYAILTTDDFFQCYPIEYITTNQWDPVGLKNNYWLHDWCTISASPFVPILVFSLTAGAALPTVTMAPTTLAVAAAAETVELGGTVQLTPTLNGTITPESYHDPVEVAPDSVLWTVAASHTESDTTTAVELNTRTYVDKKNVLHVQSGGNLASGDKITVTAVSTYMAPEGETAALTATVELTVA